MVVSHGNPEDALSFACLSNNLYRKYIKDTRIMRYPPFSGANTTGNQGEAASIPTDI